MSAISGDTTTVVPSSSSAGSWKQSDLPAPVGITATRSRPSSTASAASRCPGRKARRPKRSCRARSRALDRDSAVRMGLDTREIYLGRRSLAVRIGAGRCKCARRHASALDPPGVLASASPPHEGIFTSSSSPPYLSRVPLSNGQIPGGDPMIRIRSPLALLLAATLLVPGEVHVVTGGCLPGPHAVAARHVGGAGSAAGAIASGGELRGLITLAKDLCAAACSIAAPQAPAPQAWLCSRAAPPLREWQAEVAAPALFPTTPSSHIAPPGTPPPRH